MSGEQHRGPGDGHEEVKRSISRVMAREDDSVRGGETETAALLDAGWTQAERDTVRRPASAMHQQRVQARVASAGRCRVGW